MYDDEGMAVLLSTLDVSGLLASGFGDSGSEEERAYVESLRASGEFTTCLSDVGDERDGDVGGGPSGPCHGWELPVLLAVDPAGLVEDLDRVDQLQSLDRVAARVAAKQCEVVAAMAGATASRSSVREMQVEHEVSVARRVSRYAALRAITTARALASVFPGFGDALAAGTVSMAHCEVLVHRTRFVTEEDVLARIGRLALPKAVRMTPGAFGREVVALVARFDRDADPRLRAAVASRRVFTRPLEDGLGMLGVIHEWSVIEAIHRVVQADADALRDTRRSATGCEQAAADPAADGAAPRDATPGDATPTQDEQTRDAALADALAARVLGAIDADGALTWDRAQTQVVAHLVIDLDTLRGERDHPALLDGQPVPASTGRELAGYARAWRRIVTEPVTGASLDYGTLTYLPAPLRAYVLDRDDGCRAPGCTTRAPSRLQMDHAQPWPHGPSSSANCGTLCTRCHQLKTAGATDITDRHHDGSFTWTTLWGQTIHIPARRYLLGTDPDDPDSDSDELASDAPDPGPSVDDDPPPF
jgi:hypothetical protein